MSDPQSEKAPSAWSIIFSNSLAFQIFKWMFTWVLAILPVLFVLIKQTIVVGHYNFRQLCSTGEMFLVSIVMVAEPLGGMVVAKGKNSISLVFTLMTIVVLVCSAYFFCIIELNEDKVRNCSDALIAHSAMPSDQPQFRCTTCENNSSEGNAKAHDSLVAAYNIKKALYVKENDDFLDRVKFASLVCILTSFIVGMISVVHTHILKQRFA